MTRLHPGPAALGCAIVLAAAPGSAEACFMPHGFYPTDVNGAEVVVVGQVVHYSTALHAYAYFDIDVDEVLKGRKHIHSRTIRVTMGGSMVGERFTRPPAGPVLIALNPTPVNSFLAPGRLTVLVDGCAGAFVEPTGSEFAGQVRRVLKGLPPDPPPPPVSPSVPPPDVEPMWVPALTTADADDYYPRRAQNDLIEGVATVDCAVKDRAGRVACNVISETPQGYGFGAATAEMLEKRARVDMAGRRYKVGNHVKATWQWRFGQ